MRTTMKVLATVILLSAACGGTEQAEPYRLAGGWQVWTGTSAADAAMIAEIVVSPDLSSGSYTTQGGAAEPLTAHSFSSGTPDFTLTFGSRVVAGKLLAESNSNVFKGTVGVQAVTGVFYLGAH